MFMIWVAKKYLSFGAPSEEELLLGETHQACYAFAALSALADRIRLAGAGPVDLAIQVLRSNSNGDNTNNNLMVIVIWMITMTVVQYVSYSIV